MSTSNLEALHNLKNKSYKAPRPITPADKAESLHESREAHYNTPTIPSKRAFNEASAAGLADPPPPSKIAQLGSLASGVGGLALAAGKSMLPGLANNAIGNALGKIPGIGGALGTGVKDIISGNVANGIASIAGGGSEAAKAINAATSPGSERAANLPPGGEVFTNLDKPIKVNPDIGGDWRVKIDCDWSIFGNDKIISTLKDTGGVAWPYLPTITIATKANYSQINPTHGNYTYQAYQNSVIDDITITGDFSAETEKDAAYWIATTMFFKSATKMFFGKGENAGNPPIICNLKGYGAHIFNNVPVVIKSFNVNLTPDVDYIQCRSFGEVNMVPVFSEISVTVSPIYNRERLRKFDLKKYATGKMIVSGDDVGYL